MSITTWREEIEYAMKYSGDSWEDIESMTLSDEELDRKFDDGFGSPEGVPFTVWTKTKVYFPTEYDGSESVAFVSRNPDRKPTSHI